MNTDMYRKTCKVGSCRKANFLEGLCQTHAFQASIKRRIEKVIPLDAERDDMIDLSEELPLADLMAPTGISEEALMWGHPSVNAAFREAGIWPERRVWERDSFGSVVVAGYELEFQGVTIHWVW